MHNCCGYQFRGSRCPNCGYCPCCGHVHHVHIPWSPPRPVWNPPMYVGKADIHVQVTLSPGRGTAAHATARLAGVS